MLRDILSDGVLTHFATFGLVIFVSVFVVTCAWVLSRSRKEIHDWSHLPLAREGDEPVDDRHPPRDH